MGKLTLEEIEGLFDTWWEINKPPLRLGEEITEAFRTIAKSAFMQGYYESLHRYVG